MEKLEKIFFENKGLKKELKKIGKKNFTNSIIPHLYPTYPPHTGGR
jgi:hypothetical protein